MNIARTSTTPKSSTQKAASPAERSLKQYMQKDLLNGNVQDFLNKAYFEDEFLSTQPDNNASLGEKLTNFALRKTQGLHYSGVTSGSLLERVFEDYSPQLRDPAFKPLPAERFIDEMDHQAERYEITGNEEKSQVFKKASQSLAGMTEMTLHDALKTAGGHDDPREVILKAMQLKPNSISTETTAISELRQNVEILELKVQEAAKAEQKLSGGKSAEMSPEREALRQELKQARENLATARANPQQEGSIFRELVSEKAKEGKLLTAKERAIQSPFTGTIPEAITSSTHNSKTSALKETGQAVALGAGFAAMTGVLAGLSAAPGVGALLNGVYLSEERSFTPAVLGVAANLLGTVGLAKGEMLLAVPALAVSSACYFAAGSAYIR